MNHLFKTLITPSGSLADIDELLVPIIEQLWSKGYSTLYSCQGAPVNHIAAGRGYITGPLTNITDVSSLVQLLTNASLRELKVNVTPYRWTADFNALDGVTPAPHVFVKGHWRILDLENNTFITL